MIIFLFLLSTIFFIALYVSVRKNIELFDRLQQIDDVLQICVKVLDEQTTKIEEKTKMEVFSDEPVIKELVNDMNVAKETVINVSNLLDDLVEKQDDKENE